MIDRFVISQRPYVKLLHHQYYRNNNEVLALSLNMIYTRSIVQTTVCEHNNSIIVNYRPNQRSALMQTTHTNRETVRRNGLKKTNGP